MARLLIIIQIFIFLISASVYSTQNQADSGRSQDFYNVDNIRSFANHLKEETDFLRAAAEYDRLRFLLKTSHYADSALYYAGICYFEGGNTELAIKRFQELRNEFSQSILAPISTIRQAQATYLQARWEEVTWLLDSNNDGKSDSNLASFGANGLFCLSLARLDRWSQAEATACDQQQQNRISLQTDDLCTMIRRGRNLPTKSGFKAAILSTIIPGLGKIYAGRKADGILAFITIGTSVWQSIRGFQKDGNHSAQGWIFGIFATSLHLGNIYGSTVSVSLYNNQIKHDFFHELEIRLVYHGP